MKTRLHKKGLKARRKSVRPVKIRRSWTINPRTRIKKSAKIYSRNKVKKEVKEIFEESNEDETYGGKRS